MGRVSNLPKRLQPMLATLTDGPFDDPAWIFEDKYDGFRMVAKIESGKVTLYSRNGQVISRNYIEVAQALEGVKGDAVIDGELVALDENGVSLLVFWRPRAMGRHPCDDDAELVSTSGLAFLLGVRTAIRIINFPRDDDHPC